MRWTRNDSLAYRAFSDLGSNLAGAHRQRKLGDAYAMDQEVNPVSFDAADNPEQMQYKFGGQVQSTPFSQDQIDQGRMRAAADVYGRTGMPEQGLKLRQMAKQGELQDVQLQSAQLGLKGQQRQDKYAQNEDAWLEFQRDHANLPDEEYFPAAARFASTKIGDGKTFGVTFDPNEGWRAAVTDTGTGQVTFRGIPDRQKFDMALQRYLSPQMLQHGQKLDQEERKLGQKDRELGQKDRELGINAGLRGAQQDYYRSGADENRARARYWDRGGASGTGLRLPEADKIMLTGLERQEQSLGTALTKLDPLDPASGQQLQGISRQLMDVRKRRYDLLKKNKALPEGVTKTAFLGLPDPLQVAELNMTQFQGDELKFRQSLEAFDDMYGDAPEAAEARNAMQVFLQQQFYSRVKPQNQRGGLVQQIRQGPAQFGSTPNIQQMQERGIRLGAHGIY